MAKRIDKYKQRKDGRYSTNVSTGKYDDLGRPIKKTLYATSSKELEKKVAAIKYELDKGIYTHDSGVTFGTYALKWFETTKISKGISTRNMYSSLLRNHIELIENIRISKLTKSDIQLQINSLMEHPRQCQLLKITIKQILDCAVDDGLITKNVCSKLTMPRRVVKEKRALTDKEKEAIKHSDFTVKEKAFIYTIRWTGMRPAEMYALTRSDINFNTCEITINKSLEFDYNKPNLTYPKTNNGIRTIPVPKIVIDSLRDWMNVNHNMIIFSDSNGQYMTKAAYANIFNQAFKKINAAIGGKGINEAMAKLSPYIFRHNYCTELYYSGISLKEAQRLMGHADMQMILNVYSHLDETKENTREKIESLAN